MHRTLSERLLDEFSRWDRLGRGETVWDVPVQPEPLFIPFRGHGSFVGPQGFPDQGRRESRGLGLLRRLREPASAAEPVDDPFQPLVLGESPGFLQDPARDLTEALWTVADGVAWKPGAFEPFLYSLGAAEGPLCFEIVATGGETRLQWAVERSDSRALSDAVAQLPCASALEWRDDWLASLLLARSPAAVWSRDLALGQPFVIPLRQEFPADPLAEILGRLNRAGDEMVAIIQVRFQQCRNPWAESIWRLVTTDGGKPFGDDGSALVEGAKAKCRKPLYAATVRLSVLGENEDDVEEFARGSARPFARFEGGNGFVLADDYESSAEDVLDEIVERRTRRSGMILNGDELLALVHPPAEGAGAPGLRRLRRKTWPAPRACSERFETRLGTCGHGGSRVPCGLRTGERLRHAHVIGASGTGKSTFLLNSIIQDLQAGHGVAVLDPHGDLVDAVLDRLPEKRLADVVLFDPADSEWPVGFNILRAHSDIERNLLASDFVAIFERLSSSWGDQMTAVLGNAAMAFLESDEGGTLLDLKRFLIEKGFRERFLRTVRDREVRYFWTHEFPLLRGTTQASLLTRLNGFLRHRLIRNMVAQRGERFDVARMMDEGKVILAPLSQGLIGQENSWLLGSLLVSRVYQAALSRQSVDESRRRPFFLYLDEAHNFVTPSIAAILSGTRKYGLGLILSHQDLDQFPARENGILGSILTNCHTRVCFRLGDKDAKKLEGGFGHFDADDFQRLRTGEAICRVGASDADFSLDCEPAPPPGEGHAERRARAIQLSRDCYAVSHELLDSGEPDPGPLALSNGKPPRIPAVAHPQEANAGFEPPPDDPAEEARDLMLDEPASTEEESGMIPENAPPLGEKAPGRSPGRGGPRHKHLQQLIKQHSNGLGLRATIEAELPDRAGSVDILLEGQSLRIAFEIADGSPLEQEMRNIEKALTCGIESVVVVSDNPSHLEEIRSAALERGILTEGKVTFLESAGIDGYFSALGAGLASYETTSRGYKVKVRHADISEQEREERLAAIHRAIAEHQRDEGNTDKE